MGKIDVYQSMWAMNDTPTKEAPASLEQRVMMVKEAGFDGLAISIDDLEDRSVSKAYEEGAQIKKNDLKLGVSCKITSLASMKRMVDIAFDLEGEFLNIMMLCYFWEDEDILELIRASYAYGAEKGVKVYLETHRGTVTQDLKRAVAFVKAIPEALLTIDLSHYVVAGELEGTNEYVEKYFDVLLSRTASIHIRISNGQQVQLPLSCIESDQLDNFFRWWQKGLEAASSRLEGGETIPVVIELGPQPYQQKMMVDGQWVNDCDRFNEALIWKSMIKDLV